MTVALWLYRSGAATDVYCVEPKRVLAWIVDPTGLDGGVMFSNSATEWRF